MNRAGKVIAFLVEVDLFSRALEPVFGKVSVGECQISIDWSKRQAFSRQPMVFAKLDEQRQCVAQVFRKFEFDCFPELN